MAAEGIVHIIDDDDDARDSLAFLLETADLTVKSYPSAVAFLAALPHITAGCIVTDLRMPEIDGMELLRRLQQQGVRLPVIVITGHGDVPLAVEAMKLGAIDFLEKPFDDEAIIGAVKGAFSRHRADGERETLKGEIQKRMANLSPREREVLAGLVAGRPNKTIAFDLGISARTVEVYRANLMTKMQASSLSDLVRMALIADS
jgi:two-component system response regulator FixJ